MDTHDNADPFLLLPYNHQLPAVGPMSKHSPPSPTSPYIVPTSTYALPPMTASDKASTSALPTIIQFDPKASPSDGEEEEEEEEEDNGTASGRPKKRKSVVNLRAAAKERQQEDPGKRKIQIEYIKDKGKRHITFSKRKAGIMKKAYELATLTGTQILLLVVSESGWVYTFTTDDFKPIVKEDDYGNLSQGQKLIATCLESSSINGRPPQTDVDSNPGSTPGYAPSSSAPTTPARQMATNRRLATKASASQLASLARLQLNIPPPVPAIPLKHQPSQQHLQYAPHPESPSREIRRRPSHPALPSRAQQHQMQHQASMGNLGTGAGGGGGGQDYVEMLQRREEARLVQMGIFERDVGYGAHDTLAYISPPPTSNTLLQAYDPSLYLQQQQHDAHHQQQTSQAALYAALALPPLPHRRSSLSLASHDPDLLQSLYVHEMDEGLIGNQTYTTLQDPHTLHHTLNHVPSVLMQQGQLQPGLMRSASQSQIQQQEQHELEIHQLLAGQHHLQPQGFSSGGGGGGGGAPIGFV